MFRKSIPKWFCLGEDIKVDRGVFRVLGVNPPLFGTFLQFARVFKRKIPPKFSRTYKKKSIQNPSLEKFLDTPLKVDLYAKFRDFWCCVCDFMAVWSWNGAKILIFHTKFKLGILNNGLGCWKTGFRFLIVIYKSSMSAYGNVYNFVVLVPVWFLSRSTQFENLPI